MASSHAQLFAPLLLGTSETTIYTVPANYVLKDCLISFVNDTAVAVKVTCWAIPPSGSSSQTNKFLTEALIAAKSSSLIEVPKVGGGYVIKGLCDTLNSAAVFPMAGYVVSV